MTDYPGIHFIPASNLSNEVGPPQFRVHAPTYAVLGNYETWTGMQEWLEAFRRAGVVALENEIVTTAVGNARACSQV